MNTFLICLVLFVLLPFFIPTPTCPTCGEKYSEEPAGKEFYYWCHTCNKSGMPED